MKRLLSVLCLVLCAAAFAQYDELWMSDEVGLPQSIHILGVQNTDADPQLELVYIGEEPYRDGLVWVWALDLLTGEVDPVTDEFYLIYTDADKEPRLVDVDGDDRYEMLFLGQRDAGDYAAWYLYGFAGTASKEGKYTRLRGPRLGQNHPNPLNQRTTIEYEVPSASQVKVSIYDASGRVVKELNQGLVPAGRHSVTWRRDANDGRAVPGGSYFYVLEVNGSTQVRKALVSE